ncbi:MAG: thioesterase family protein [Planctomycetales bacterium]|nr:thioesterase family protein [Planctomycetales bacterium]
MPKIKLDIAGIRRLPLTHTATIPEEYLDAMGHMNVAWYTHLFSVAMGGIFKQLGLTWEVMEKHHGGSFALEAHVRYLSEVRIGQAIEIHTRFLARTEKRFHAMHYMFNEDKQDVSATFEAVGAYIDMRTRRMAVMPSDVGQPLDALIAQHAELDWPSGECGVMQA